MTRPRRKSSPSVSGRKPIKPRARRFGTYVYCIVEAASLDGIMDSAPEGLQSGRKLELVESAGFAAVASAVPLSDYGQPALDNNLTDTAWAASRVMCHERVVEYFASRRAVIPLRFGTIYIDRKSIGRMLEDRTAQLSSMMERLRGREEWGVSIYCDRAKLIDTRVSNNSAIRPLLDRIGSARPGRSYLLSKQVDALKVKATREEISTALLQMKKVLDAASEQSISTPQPERDRAEQPQLIAQLSFLVETRRFGRFRASAERLAETYLPSGFSIELVGPLPPYSFVAETSTRASAH